MATTKKKKKKKAARRPRRPVIVAVLPAAERLPVRQRRRRAATKAGFLDAMADCGTVTEACALSGVGRRTVYDWVEHDAAFAKQFDDAREMGTDQMEAEARRRGGVGWLEPVFYLGQVVGYVRKHSDACLLAVLGAYRPERFKNRHEHSGKDGSPLVPAVVHVSYHESMKPPQEPT